LCGRAYAGLLAGISGNHIAGIPVAALPLATAAALASGRGLIYPRLETKTHGTGARVEGVWEAGQTTILLDDLITSGTSKREAVEVLRSAGLIVNDLVVLIERGEEGRRDMAEAGIRLHAWARIEDLLDAGLTSGYLDEATSNEVRSYVREL
jgi:uridine monophosphate synthetase